MLPSSGSGVKLQGKKKEKKEKKRFCIRDLLLASSSSIIFGILISFSTCTCAIRHLTDSNVLVSESQVLNVCDSLTDWCHLIGSVRVNLHERK